MAILDCLGCGRGGLRVPDGRRGKVTCPRCGAEWFFPESLEVSEIEFRCAASGSRFVVALTRRSPLHKFVIQAVKHVPRPAAERPSANDAGLAFPTAKRAGSDDARLPTRAKRWLALIGGFKGQLQSSKLRQQLLATPTRRRPEPGMPNSTIGAVFSAPTDRNDARGIAQMMRVGLYRPVHVKTLRSQKLRMMLTHRKLLQSKAIAIENDLRGTLRNFGLKVGIAGKTKFEARIKELVENLPDLAELVEPMLVVRRTLREQIVILHRRLLAIVRDDEVCRRLMTTPGVGPVVALTYRATVDVPARFRKSKSVGAVFGLTCSKYQSGEIDWSGRISRCGDEMMRTMLYEAAQVMLTRTNKWSWLKAWAMQIARRRGMKKAIVALARRLAVILHRIWVDGTEFRWTREQAVAA